MGKKIDHGKHIAPIGFFIDITLLLRAINIGGCNKKEMNTDLRVLFLQLKCYIL